jgi:hypothetical protein
MAWYDQEKHALNFQIREIRHILNITQQHMTNTIFQVRKFEFCFFNSIYVYS